MSTEKNDPLASHTHDQSCSCPENAQRKNVCVPRNLLIPALNTELDRHLLLVEVEQSDQIRLVVLHRLPVHRDDLVVDHEAEVVPRILVVDVGNQAAVLLELHAERLPRAELLDSGEKLGMFFGSVLPQHR